MPEQNNHNNVHVHVLHMYSIYSCELQCTCSLAKTNLICMKSLRLSLTPNNLT